MSKINRTPDLEVTPKTLADSILESLRYLEKNSLHSTVSKTATIEVHVRDYLAGKFSVAMIQNEKISNELSELFKSIVGESK